MFPEDKALALAETYRVLKPGAAPASHLRRRRGVAVTRTRRRIRDDRTHRRDAYQRTDPRRVPASRGVAATTSIAGGILVATTWDDFDLLKLTKDIMTEVLGEVPPTPALDPMSLAEEGLFSGMVADAGFTDVVQKTSTYPLWPARLTSRVIAAAATGDRFLRQPRCRRDPAAYESRRRRGRDVARRRGRDAAIRRFDLGTDPKFQSNFGTILVREKIFELDKWDVAEKAFSDNIGKYTTTLADGSMSMPANTFRMTVATK